MQNFEPSMHTKLINLSILLGMNNDCVDPVLLKNGYPLRAIALKIPLHELGRNISTSPDTGFSSKENNSILFIECKSGGIDSDKENSQLERFSFIQKNIETVLRTKNEFDVRKDNLTVDFAILCSDINKIMSDHKINKINFPVIFYDEEKSVIKLTNFNGAKFKEHMLDNIFSNQILAKKVSNLLYPFGPYDIDKSFAYILKNIFLMIIEENMNLTKFERMPSLHELFIKRFPILKLLGKEEFNELIIMIKEIFKKLFPDINTESKLNIQKYISYKQGKILIKKSTINKFLETMEYILKQIESKRRQTNLQEFLPGITGLDVTFLSDINWDIF